ncbi:hypothetical protein PBY51_012626 [Eleginops maclovinus]|uniref:Fibronectin type-III domain-containing protein n=1 Tax=Eleginops maclovinus TaxID=56733 RepID=A0AAN8AQY2_ELEMC|nr:hypothetical protein PBY51_012626 [Eleginops maclovinus]
MEDVKCATQEIRTQTVQDLYNQILHLRSTALSDNSIMVRQRKLRLLQRSSFYLEIRVDEMPAAAEGEQPLDNAVSSLTDERRLQRAMALGRTQVKLLLTVMGQLYEVITRSCRELEAFIVKYKQGLVDSDMVASVQQKTQQALQHVHDFDTRLTRNCGPLNLQNQLAASTANLQTLKLSALLSFKAPVTFDQVKSRVTSNSVHLFWEVEHSSSKELNQMFEIHIENCHPTLADEAKLIYACKSYELLIDVLEPDRNYKFSVRRVHASNLLYGLWMDSINLKTLDISK